MNKELQDKAWAVLPKEFREEVRNMYDSVSAGGETAVVLRELFGKHNLTSDIYEEEILTVPRSEIIDIYHDMMRAQEGYSAPQRRANIFLLQQLFGKKCMPDESNSETKFKVGDLVTVHLLNGESLTGNIYEVMADSSYDVRMVDGSMMHNVGCERISPYIEKKFFVGDKVLISDDPRIGKNFRGRIGTVVFICSSDKRIVDVGNGVVPECFHISHLAPYIEPKQGSESAQNENNGNHNVGSENKQPAVRIYRPNINLTSPSDNQLRIMVAAEVMKGMLANTNVIMSCGDLEDNQEYITKHAVEYADTLIKEINGKGGNENG